MMRPIIKAVFPSLFSTKDREYYGSSKSGNQQNSNAAFQRIQDGEYR